MTRAASLTAVACAAMLVAGLGGAASAADPYCEGTTAARGDDPWAELRSHRAAPDWFRDAKLGIYAHWGVYSVPAFVAEWYPRWMFDGPADPFPFEIGKLTTLWHSLTYGPPRVFGYHDFVPMFAGERFNAAKWADLYRRAGARFAGPVAEHHDGFSMWASDVNPWNAADRGPRRDVVGELEREVRARGMRFVTTFHHSWQDYYPRREGWPTTSSDPELQALYRNIPREDFLAQWAGKLDEVVERYAPDLVYFDFNFVDIELEPRRGFVRRYLDDACERDAEVVVVHKSGALPDDVGVEDFEARSAEDLRELPWLTDLTVTSLLGAYLGPWGYVENPPNLAPLLIQVREPRQVLHHLIDVVSKNGQLLLNVAPRADGSIPEDQQQLLLAIGAWLGRFGEAIYGTRPFVISGHGPTEPPPGAGNLVPMPRYTPEDVRYTRDGDRIYALLLGWPGSGAETLLEGFAAEHGFEVRSVSVLGSDELIGWSVTPEGLRVRSPSRSPDPDRVALVYRVQVAAGSRGAASR